MELRTHNVKRTYFRCVKVRIGSELGVNRETLESCKRDIQSMCDQLPLGEPLEKCHIRTDGEQWTPYLQIVEMIFLLGVTIGYLKKPEVLNKNTIVEKCQEQ